MLCVLLICAFLALVRCLPFLAQHKDKEKYAMYAMKIPVVFLVDVWYRSCMNSACGPVLRWLIDNGWWNESQWPTSHLDYFRYLLVPVSLFLLAADACHLPAIFIDTIGDSSTVAVLFAASQKFVGHQDDRNKISCRKLANQSAMLGGHVDHAPSELLIRPPDHPEIVNFEVLHTTQEETCEWRFNQIEAVGVFLIAAVVHSRTSSITGSQSAHRYSVRGTAAGFLVAPLLYIVGVPWWWVSWINWFICNLCAVTVAVTTLCTSAVSLGKYFDHINTVIVEEKQMTPLFFAFIYLRRFLLVSYLSYIFLQLIAALLSHTAPEITLSGNSLYSFLTMSTASPLAFYCYCLVAAYVYVFIIQLFAAFLVQNSQGLGHISPEQHMQLITLMFAQGVWCYFVDLPVWISPIIPVISLTPSTLLGVQQYANNCFDIVRNQWYYIRAKCIYIVIFMLPPVSLVIIWYNYDHTSPLFILALPSLHTCFQLSGEFIRHVVWALEGWRFQAVQYNAYELCSCIKRGMEYVSIIFHCGVAVFCVYVCIFEKWAWSTLPTILTMPLVALGQYIMIKAADRSKRLLDDMVNSLPLPEYNDPRLVDDICPICHSTMQQFDSRTTLCGHLFHRQCLVRWAEIRQTCPSCQQNLVYNIQTPSDLQESV